MSMNQPAGRPQQLARQIEVAIAHHEIKPNERLPTERELAQRWQVSRSTVREALGLLVAKGLLTRRQGDGTYIKGTAPHSSMWAEMTQHHPDLQVELLEFRHMLECQTAELAALRHDTRDRTRLEAAAAGVDAAFLGSDTHAQLEADFALHRTIAESAHNPLFAYLMASLQELLNDHMRLSLAGISAEQKRAVRAQHAVLVKSILDREPVRAALAAAGHIDYVRSAINHLEPATPTKAPAHHPGVLDESWQRLAGRGFPGARHSP